MSVDVRNLELLQAFSDAISSALGSKGEKVAVNKIMGRFGPQSALSFANAGDVVSDAVKSFVFHN